MSSSFFFVAAGGYTTTCPNSMPVGGGPPRPLFRGPSSQRSFKSSFSHSFGGGLSSHHGGGGLLSDYGGSASSRRSNGFASEYGGGLLSDYGGSIASRRTKSFASHSGGGNFSDYGGSSISRRSPGLSSHSGSGFFSDFGGSSVSRRSNGFASHSGGSLYSDFGRSSASRRSGRFSSHYGSNHSSRYGGSRSSLYGGGYSSHHGDDLLSHRGSDFNPQRAIDWCSERGGGSSSTYGNPGPPSLGPMAMMCFHATGAIPVKGGVLEIDEILLDSGASSSFIKKELAIAAGLHIRSGDHQSFAQFNGNQFHVSQRATAELFLGGVGCTIDFYIQPAEVQNPCSIILGIPAFTAFRMKLGVGKNGNELQATVSSPNGQNHLVMRSPENVYGCPWRMVRDSRAMHPGEVTTLMMARGMNMRPSARNGLQTAHHAGHHNNTKGDHKHDKHNGDRKHGKSGHHGFRPGSIFGRGFGFGPSSLRGFGGGKSGPGPFKNRPFGGAFF